MTSDELKSYYSNLLILQYHNKTRAVGTVKAFVGEVLADLVAVEVRDGFDLETAVGAQLDILATYRGLNRIVYGLNFNRSYFAMPEYTDPNKDTYGGFASYTDAVVSGYFLYYIDVNVPIYTMSDGELRRLIMLSAAFSSSSLGLGEIDAILFDFFSTKVKLTDNENMQIVYNDDPADTDELFYIATNTKVLPKPAGVSVAYTYL